jgi:hypothetical protein
MSPWFGEDVIRERTALADEIIGILTSTIERLRSSPPAPRPSSDSPPARSVREEGVDYDA